MPQGHATALYDHSGSLQGGSMGDPSDPVTARWLQSAGLQHLASPLASSSGMDHRLIPNFFNQGYTQSYDDKQRLFKMLKSMNLGIEPGSEPFTPTAQSSAPSAETFLSPELRGEFSAGLLDLHSMDDTELFNEYAGTEPFETSPFMSSGDKGFANDSDTVAIGKQKVPAENMFRAPLGEKESIGKENNLAKIKVVVRKRPLNKKELARKEEDIVSVNDNVWLTVHEPKLKVDLTAYVEKHDFVFDAILDDHVSNDEVYRVTVEPIVPTIFQRTKATCFAYGQTGSGKTYTMQPLPLRACEDILKMMNQPYYEDQGFRLWLSFFEIYGGKLYDLLNDRKKLCMREDGRQQVCIVGLCEFEVSDIQSVKEYIEKGSGTRSTGSTGANEESSRSHAILQLTIKKHHEGKDSKAAKAAKIVGKLSFIDLAGSERGADTTDNDRQTRMEGAEINKSLLALKECIRALDNDQIHIPFRGSKLTEVLRDSFVGNSRTVMISCVSPNSGSCEHTLNTLRYADRVKGLSKSSNLRKDQVSSSTTQIPRESSSLTLPSGESKDFSDHNQALSFESSRRSVETQQYGNQSEELDKNSSGLPSVMPYGTREENGYSNYIENRANTRESIAGSASQKNSSTNLSSLDINGEEKAQKVSPTRRKTREDKPERQPNWGSKEESRADGYNAVRKQQYQSRDELSNNQGPTKVKESTTSAYDNDINAILQEEEALIAAHRKEIEDTMELVREEMQLLTEVEQPGSLIDDYVSKLSIVLSHKAAGLVSLQARLARFQKRLKEHEILSMKKTLNSK